MGLGLLKCQPYLFIGGTIIVDSALPCHHCIPQREKKEKERKSHPYLTQKKLTHHNMRLKHTHNPLQLHLYRVATPHQPHILNKNKRPSNKAFLLSLQTVLTSHKPKNQKRKKKLYIIQIPCAYRQSHGPIY